MDKVVHFEIPADDMDRAQQFYKTVFDWKLTSVPEMDYVMVNTVDIDDNNMPIELGAINGGMLKRRGDIISPVVYMGVDNIDASMSKIEENGGKVIIPKQKVGDSGWSCYARDTEGNIIGVWQPSSGTEEL